MESAQIHSNWTFNGKYTFMFIQRLQEWNDLFFFPPSFIQNKCATHRSSSRSVKMPTSFPWIISYCGSLPRPRSVWPENEPVVSGARSNHASSCRSPRQCRRIDEEEIGIWPQISRSFIARASWWRGEHFFFFFCNLKSTLIRLFFPLSSLSMSEIGQHDTRGVQLRWFDVSGLIPHFSGHFFLTWRCSVEGWKRWEATLTDLNWCDSTRVFSLNPPSGTMSS